VDQFKNWSNPKGNERTGEEIWRQSGGRVNAFATLLGSGGSFTGVARALKAHNKEIRCYAIEPATAPFLAGGRVTNTMVGVEGADEELSFSR